MELEVQDLDKIQQNLDEMDDVLEPIKVASAFNSRLGVLQWRLQNKPKDVSILDYTELVALQRQIPTTVEDIQDDKYICPNCGTENIASNYEVPDNYCPVCGQRLLVEEETEESEEEDQAEGENEVLDDNFPFPLSTQETTTEEGEEDDEESL